MPTEPEPLLPCNREAERALLGAVLRDNAALDETASLVRPGDFFTDAHQVLWACYLALRLAGKTVDLVTVADWLFAHKHVPNVNYEYLAELFECGYHPSGAAGHAALVRDKALQRDLATAGAVIRHHALSPTGPVDDMLVLAEREVFALSEARYRGRQVVDLSHAIGEACDALDNRQQRQRGDGVSTGFADLDKMTDGFHVKELTLLAARPGCGKTALALAISRNLALAGHAVFFASLEQSYRELADRLLCGESLVDGHRFRLGVLGRDEQDRVAEASHKLAPLRVWIDDTAGQSVTQVASRARVLKRQHGISLVVIDYLQLMDPEGQGRSRQEEVAFISRRLKALAKELSLPVLALAQLNREVEYRKGERPRLADLRDSGSLEQDADAVLLLHRQESVPGVVEVIVAKQRNGPTGTLKLAFRKESTRFDNYAEYPS